MDMLLECLAVARRNKDYGNTNHGMLVPEEQQINREGRGSLVLLLLAERAR